MSALRVTWPGLHFECVGDPEVVSSTFLSAMGALSRIGMAPALDPEDYWTGEPELQPGGAIP